MVGFYRGSCLKRRFVVILGKKQFIGFFFMILESWVGAYTFYLFAGGGFPEIPIGEVKNQSGGCEKRKKRKRKEGIQILSNLKG